MKYKIYRLSSFCQISDAIKEVIEDDEFQNEEFDSIDEASDSITRRGAPFCNYTILPYIYLEH